MLLKPLPAIILHLSIDHLFKNVSYLNAEISRNFFRFGSSFFGIYWYLYQKNIYPEIFYWYSITHFVITALKDRKKKAIVFHHILDLLDFYIMNDYRNLVSVQKIMHYAMICELSNIFIDKAAEKKSYIVGFLFSLLFLFVRIPAIISMYRPIQLFCNFKKNIIYYICGYFIA